MANLLNLVQGDTAKLRFEIINPDKSPVDLRTYDVIKFTIKRSTQDSDEGAVWQGSMVAGDIAIDDTITAHNIIDVVVPKEATKDMRSGRVYYWDVTIEDDAGNVFTPLQGTILVTDDVTLG